MIGIFPLAGPDFVLPDGTLRPLYSVDNEPLLHKVISSRKWVKEGTLKSNEMIFILRDTPLTFSFIKKLKEWFPGCKYTITSDLTKGALMSSLLAIPLIADFEDIICIDLVDILYDFPENIVSIFQNENISGVIPWFHSSNPNYSYLKLSGNFVIETKEKEVISNFASSGTYFFRNTHYFLQAVNERIKKRNERYLYFLCPTFNELILNGNNIIGIEVTNVHSLSLFFHHKKERKK